MADKQELKLTWIGKENRPKPEPRTVLEAAGTFSHAFLRRLTDSAIFDNRPIIGSNVADNMRLGAMT